MLIKNLAPGTKLMWDAPGSPGINNGEPIIYPAIVTEKHHQFPWVKIKSGSVSNWMGPEQDYLRLPTEEELKSLTWPTF